MNLSPMNDIIVTPQGAHKHGGQLHFGPHRARCALGRGGLTDKWIKSLVEAGQIDKRFNIQFFTSSDSREPELAGVRGALTGTMLTMLVTLVLSFPLGVLFY